MQKKGVLFVFSGPSGVGKGTLKAKLFEELDRKSTRLNSSHWNKSRMPSSA